MAAHVVVIDTTARSMKIKTTPGKHLMEILEESCAKLGRDSNLYGLKHKSKNLDLSRTVMLSGLSPGARLELVAASRSPSVVSVALQLPQAESNGTARLSDKFSSTTTLWLMLRKFESEIGSTRNFTARSAPLDSEQTAGSGRLFFETPVITVMSRELATFTDLQKSLAQLGVNEGSILLRLSFRKTETPLEDAMMEIEQYFKGIATFEETNQPKEAVLEASKSSAPQSQHSLVGDSSAGPASHREPADIAKDDLHAKDTSPKESGILSPGSVTPNPEKSVETVRGPSDRPIAVFAPPTSSTPKAALQPYNDDDFEPTLDHVRSHQRYLQANGKNQTLKSDAQLAAEAEIKAQKAAEIREVEIKLRFPDQSQVSSSFNNLDTARNLYDHAKGLMRNSNEPISLTFAGAKGRLTVPFNSDVKLISDLGLRGRVLVEVAWGDTSSLEARQGPTLKDEYRVKAQEQPVKVIEGVDVQQEKETLRTEVKDKEKEVKKGTMPKWFKGIGKK